MATLADYGPEVRAEVKQVREVVATLHEQLIKWNLVVWTAGNVSQRLHTADLMVIKPSGLRYEYLTPSSWSFATSTATWWTVPKPRAPTPPPTPTSTATCPTSTV